jgi:hypothetical protein
VRRDLTPSGQIRNIEEVLMTIDEHEVEEAVASEAAPFNIVLEARP